MKDFLADLLPEADAVSVGIYSYIPIMNPLY